MNLQEVGCGVMDWIELAEDRDRRRPFATAVMKLLVQNIWELLDHLKTG